jgi:Xaa-Pro aminopeptidase
VIEDGYFHSLGHGVGLEVRAARAARAGEELLAGDVVTSRAGLYRRLGGCRLEISSS